MFERRLPVQYRARESTLAPWNELRVEPEIVRKALLVLARAFRWTEADALRLRPEDELWPIYRTYYPQTHWWQRWGPDELEMESLLIDLERAAPTGRTLDLDLDITIEDLVRFLAP